MVISGSYDQTVKIWDIETREVIKTLTDHEGHVIQYKLFKLKIKRMIFASLKITNCVHFYCI